MRKISTLIYFVNNFQNDLEINTEVDLNFEIENFLTAMDNEPSESSVKNILDFARSYEVLESEKTGFVELNLN